MPSKLLGFTPEVLKAIDMAVEVRVEQRIEAILQRTVSKLEENFERKLRNLEM